MLIEELYRFRSSKLPELDRERSERILKLLYCQKPRRSLDTIIPTRGGGGGDGRSGEGSKRGEGVVSGGREKGRILIEFGAFCCWLECALSILCQLDFAFLNSAHFFPFLSLSLSLALPLPLFGWLVSSVRLCLSPSRSQCSLSGRVSVTLKLECDRRKSK